MKRIYLVRHGESEANVAKVHGGDTPLTELGRQQAEFIAERVSKLPVQRIVSSTLKRAHATAEAIGRKVNLPVEASDLFVELEGPPEFDGVEYTDPRAVEAYAQLRENYGTPGWRYGKAENFDDHTARAQAALNFLLNKPEEHIVVASHGLFLRLLLAHAVFGPTPSAAECQKIMRGFETQNTSLSIIDHKEKWFDGIKLENPWQVVAWNDQAHLAD